MSGATGADPLISGNADWEDAERRAAGAGRVWFSDEGPSLALAAGFGRRFPGVRIGMLVDARRRPVTVLAKQLTSLDVLIDGRVDVGLEGEHTAEVAGALRILATGQPLVHHGPLVRSEGARSLPPSPQTGGFPLFRITDQGPGWVRAEPL